MKAIIGGTTYSIKINTFQAEDTIEMRATCSFSIPDKQNEYTFKKGQPVTIIDDKNNDEQIFAGFLETSDKYPLSSRQANAYMHDIVCIDMHYLADKRRISYAARNKLAGDIIKDIVDQKLVEEGVYYSKDLNFVETTTADFSTGTLSNVVAENDSLRLDKTGADITDTDTTTADFAEGTLTDVVAVNDGLGLAERGYVDKIPEMTSNTTPSGVASADSVYQTDEPYKAFDKTEPPNGDISSQWRSTINTNYHWLKYEFETAKKVEKIYINSTQNIEVGTHDFVFQGSNDNSNWVNLYSDASADTYTSPYEATFSNNNFYKYYRYYINSTDASDNRATITELKLYQYDYYSTGTRQSPQLDLSAVGNVESSSISWQETLNSQTITIETSIDGGSTWQTATNGGAIPNLPANPTTLDVRQVLSTTDTTVTPRLESLEVEVVSAYETTGYRISKPFDLSPAVEDGGSTISWQQSNQYFGIVGGWHSDMNILGNYDGYSEVASITQTTSYDDIFTGQFTISDFPNYAGAGKYVYMEFWAKWSTIPVWGQGQTWIQKPPPDASKYQKYILKSDGQNDIDEYFRLYYSTSQIDESVAYIANPKVYTEFPIKNEVSLDNKKTWFEISNGQPIPNLPTDLMNERLYYKTTLETDDTSVTPTFDEINIDITSNGTTIEDGTEILETRANFVPTEQLISSVADKMNYWWKIDSNKMIHFKSRDSEPADWQLEPQYIRGLPTAKTGNPLYRNQQLVKGPIGITEEQVDVERGDGDKKAFPVSFPIAEEPTIEISINGGAWQTQTVGRKGVDDGFQWYWEKESDIITHDNAESRLTSNDRVRCTFIGQFKIVAQTYDPNLISKQADIDGTSGIVEDAITVGNVEGREAAIEIGNSRIKKYGVDSKRLKFQTRRSGLKAGQLITVNNLTNMGINQGEKLLITRTNTFDENGQIFYDIEAVKGPKHKTWEEFFMELTKRAELVISEGIGESEILIIPIDFSKTWTFAENPNIFRKLKADGTWQADGTYTPNFEEQHRVTHIAWFNGTTELGRQERTQQDVNTADRVDTLTYLGPNSANENITHFGWIGGFRATEQVGTGVLIGKQPYDLIKKETEALQISRSDYSWAY